MGRIKVVAEVGRMLSMETKLGREYNVVEFLGNNKDEVAKLWMRRAVAKTFSVVCDDTNIGILVVHKLRVGREEFKSGLGITETIINDGNRYDLCFEVPINRHTFNRIEELVLGFTVAVEVVHKDGGIVPVVLDFGWGQKCCRKSSIIRSVVLWDKWEKVWDSSVINFLSLSLSTWARSTPSESSLSGRRWVKWIRFDCGPINGGWRCRL